jgi:hypothetical protein
LVPFLIAISKNMNRKDLGELLKYSSSEWIYVVTYRNELLQLFCPFRIVVLTSVGGLYKGQILHVSMVKVTKDLVTVFLINGDAYYFYHFEILID